MNPSYLYHALVSVTKNVPKPSTKVIKIFIIFKPQGEFVLP